MARKEIAQLQADKSGEYHIIGWKLDKEKFRATPFYTDGKGGPPINLRILFEEYHGQVSGQ